jgi:hypothetical protein
MKNTAEEMPMLSWVYKTLKQIDQKYRTKTKKKKHLNG